MAKPKLEFGLVCDDVRQEIGNKLTYVGVYGPSPEIYISKVPSTLPKLCFALSFANIKKGASFSMHIEDPSGKTIAEIKNGVVPQEPAKKVTLFASFSPLNIKKAGAYKVIVTFDGDKKGAHEMPFSIKEQSNQPKK